MSGSEYDVVLTSTGGEQLLARSSDAESQEVLEARLSGGLREGRHGGHDGAALVAGQPLQDLPDVGVAPAGDLADEPAAGVGERDERLAAVVGVHRAAYP